MATSGVVAVDVREAEYVNHQALAASMEALAERWVDSPGFRWAALHVGIDGPFVALIVEWEGVSTVVSTEEADLDGRVGRSTSRSMGGVYDVVFSDTQGGGGSVAIGALGEHSGAVVMIDVIETDRDRFDQAVAFSVENARAFQSTRGYRTTALMAGHERRTYSTYAHWDSIGAWINAVGVISGEFLPAVLDVSSIAEMNTILQSAGEGLGSHPEYHAYQLTRTWSP